MDIFGAHRVMLIVSFCSSLFSGCAYCMTESAASAQLDLTDAVIVIDSSETVHARAGDMLSDEITNRTGVRLELTHSMPKDDQCAIVIKTVEDMNPMLSEPGGLEVPGNPEGYAIWVHNNRVYLVGRDDRGALFAAGRLIRLLAMSKGRVGVSADLRLADAPEYPIRGHQLGYRGLNNTYDTWDLQTYEQYVRDLIIFGTNAIELIPTFDPTKKSGPHMKKPMWQMNRALSEMAGSYGLDVWMWIKVTHREVKTPEAQKQAMAKRRRLFESLPHLDAVFVPGGDGGDTPVEVLMPWLGRLARVMHEVHPRATLWVSNQTFEAKDNDFFFSYLQNESPDWLTGVVYGPWTTVGIPEVRRRTPRKYKLRRYPDICHCLGCQYPVPQWDRTFSQTYGREPICPRPRGMAHIHNLYAPLADGFITYSDGVNDDLNKFIWTSLGWDSKTNVETILQEYGRTFFGDKYADAVARGLSKLEQNWVGPVAENEGVDDTLRIWQDIARQGGDDLAGNWRLQLYLFRAHYDSFLKHRAVAELTYQAEAYEALQKAREIGVTEAINQACSALARADTEKPARQLRERTEILGRELFESIGLQMSTKAPYRASGQRRGAVMDYLDRPLNDRLWLENQFRQILRLQDKEAGLARIERIVNWDDPGPGGFYDDLGFVGRAPHLVRQKTWRQDPQFLESPIAEQFYTAEVFDANKLSWRDQAQIRYRMGAYPPDDKFSPEQQTQWLAQDKPLLTMRYDRLDPEAGYRVRVTYHGRFRPTVKLIADDKYEIHGPLAQPTPTWPVEFDVPKEATKDGKLELQWHLMNKTRGCQVAEIWLIKEN